MPSKKFFEKSKVGPNTKISVSPRAINFCIDSSRSLTLKDIERKLSILNARFDGKFYVELDKGRFKLKWEGLR